MAAARGVRDVRLPAYIGTIGATVSASVGLPGVMATSAP